MGGGPVRVDFLQLKRVSEAQRLFLEACPQGPLGVETVPLHEAAGRVAALGVKAPHDLPAFHRSTVDGYAVRAADTFGASEGLPVYLRIVEDIPMGRAPTKPLGPGECAVIATGGMLPENADAVVMVEHTELLAEGEVGVLHPAAPWTNVMRRGEDCAAGAELVAAGTGLRPQELGMLAHAGVTEVPVARRPTVAIVGTGDELVPAHQEPGPGQIRESNSYTLYALVAAAGGEPVILGTAADDEQAIREKIEEGLRHDVLLLSGGSSIGMRDLTARLFAELGPPGIIVHGVSLKPAKPTILAAAHDTPAVGLPGNPVSAQVSFFLFVQPLLRQLLGLSPFPEYTSAIRARMAKNYGSAIGRVDVLRVALYRRDGELWAEPVQDKSGLISTLTRADGMVIVEENRECIRAGDWVDVLPV